MDVGGGLGVDYEGTRSRSANSINYTIEDYARTVVDTIAEVCDAAGEARPEICSESGRALVAQHAVLVTNVIDTDVPTDTRPVEPPGTAARKCARCGTSSSAWRTARPRRCTARPST
jgi:arginine decarboxylase